MSRTEYPPEPTIGRKSRPFEAQSTAMVWWGILAMALVVGLIVFEVLDWLGVVARG